MRASIASLHRLLRLFVIAIVASFGLNFNQAWANNALEEDRQGTLAAYHYLNDLRESLRLPTLRQNRLLNQSALQHARYATQHDHQGHDESAENRGYHGKTPQDRGFNAGYASDISEVISYNAASPEKYIDDLMSAIYHRLSLLDMTKDEMGASLVRDHQGLVKGTFVANLGNQNLNLACKKIYRFANGTEVYRGVCHHDNIIAKTTVEQINRHTAASSPKLIMWPKSGATVPPVFYEENPDPLPNCNVSGYPIHLQINPNFWGKIQFKPDSFELTDITTPIPKPVEALTVFSNLTDPNHHTPHTTDNQWIAFFPKERLHWNSRYQAQVQWVENGRLKTTRWAFFTPKLSPMMTASSSDNTFNVKPNQTFYLYFPPQTCQAPMRTDLSARHIRGFEFSTEFIDAQTLKVTLGKKTGKLLLTLHPNNTRVTLNIE